METNTKEVISLEPDKVIEFAQQTRIEMITDVSTEEQNKVTLLRDLSATALTIKRLSTDDRNAAADRDIAAAMVTAISNLSANPFLSQKVIRRDLEMPELPPVELVPDETSTTLADLTFEDI